MDSFNQPGANGGSVSRRIEMLDALRGLAILLVVIGHSIEQNIPSYESDPLFRIIYSFHIPLFMFVSGFLAFPKIASAKPVYLRDKFLYLVVPFIAWYLLGYLLLVLGAFFGGSGTIPTLGEYLLNGILYPDNGLWFLWVLFLSFCCLYMTLKLGGHLHDYGIVAAILLLQLIPTQYFGIPDLKWSFIPFSVGYIVAEHRGRIMLWKDFLVAASIVSFPFLLLFWRRGQPPAFISLINSLQNLGTHTTTLIVTVYNFVVPFVGIVYAWVVMDLIRRVRSVFGIFCWLGTVTFDIYVSEHIFLGYGVGFGEGYVLVLSASFVAILLALTLSFLVLRRNTILARLFLGRWKDLKQSAAVAA